MCCLPVAPRERSGPVWPRSACVKKVRKSSLSCLFKSAHFLGGRKIQASSFARAVPRGTDRRGQRFGMERIGMGRTMPLASPRGADECVRRYTSVCVTAGRRRLDPQRTSRRSWHRREHAILRKGCAPSSVRTCPSAASYPAAKRTAASRHRPQPAARP